MIHGWIIYDQKQYSKNKWFAERLLECGEVFSDVRLIITERLWYGIRDGMMHYVYEGEDIAAPSFAVMRSIQPMLSFSLEKSGCRVFNKSEVSKICNDKRLTYAVLSNTGIPMMETAFYEPELIEPAVFEQAEYPLVIKTAAGHGGSEVFLAESAQDIYKILAKIEGKAFLAQKLLVPYGRDLRVYVVGGEIFKAVLRTSDSFRSNYSLGGSAQEYSLNERETELVNRVLRNFPVTPDLAGVDFLVSENGLIFNEIEDVVGTRMLYACTDADPVQALMEHVERTVVI